MEQRRELKRSIISLTTILRSRDLSNNKRKEIERKIQAQRELLDSTEMQLDKQEIQQRRQFLAENRGLSDVFTAMWVTLLSYTEEGILSKEGYSKFHHAIDIVLAGHRNFGPINQADLDNDWTHDTLLFGPMKKEAFFDYLFETIETWSDLVQPSYYAAFAWTLLDSIADVSFTPPRLRAPREMRCIMKMTMNDASLLKTYMEDKKLRAALTIQADMMERVPEVQKRLQGRKLGMEISNSNVAMLEAVAKDVVVENAQSLTSSTTVSLDGSDDQLSEGTSTAGDGIDDGAWDLAPGTDSFMSYVNGRRESKLIMNGDMPLNVQSYSTQLGSYVEQAALTGSQFDMINSTDNGAALQIDAVSQEQQYQQQQQLHRQQHIPLSPQAHAAKNPILSKYLREAETAGMSLHQYLVNTPHSFSNAELAAFGVKSDMFDKTTGALLEPSRVAEYVQRQDNTKVHTNHRDNIADKFSSSSRPMSSLDGGLFGKSLGGSGLTSSPVVRAKHRQQHYHSQQRTHAPVEREIIANANRFKPSEAKTGHTSADDISALPMTDDVTAMEEGGKWLAAHVSNSSDFVLRAPTPPKPQPERSKAPKNKAVVKGNVSKARADNSANTTSKPSSVDQIKRGAVLNYQETVDSIPAAEPGQASFLALGNSSSVPLLGQSSVGGRNENIAPVPSASEKMDTITPFQQYMLKLYAEPPSTEQMGDLQPLFRNDSRDASATASVVTKVSLPSTSLEPPNPQSAVIGEEGFDLYSVNSSRLEEHTDDGNHQENLSSQIGSHVDLINAFRKEQAEQQLQAKTFYKSSTVSSVSDHNQHQRICAGDPRFVALPQRSLLPPRSSLLMNDSLTESEDLDKDAINPPRYLTLGSETGSADLQPVMLDAESETSSIGGYSNAKQSSVASVTKKKKKEQHAAYLRLLQSRREIIVEKDEGDSSFPHGRYSALVKNTMAMRQIPPLSPPWDHKRASETTRGRVVRKSKASKHSKNTLADVKYREKPIDGALITKKYGLGVHVQALTPLSFLKAKQTYENVSKEVNRRYNMQKTVQSQSEPGIDSGSVGASNGADISVGELPSIAMGALMKKTEDFVAPTIGMGETVFEDEEVEEHGDPVLSDGYDVQNADAPIMEDDKSLEDKEVATLRVESNTKNKKTADGSIVQEGSGSLQGAGSVSLPSLPQVSSHDQLGNKMPHLVLDQEAPDVLMRSLALLDGASARSAASLSQLSTLSNNHEDLMVRPQPSLTSMSLFEQEELFRQRQMQGSADINSYLPQHTRLNSAGVPGVLKLQPDDAPRSTSPSAMKRSYVKQGKLQGTNYHVHPSIFEVLRNVDEARTPKLTHEEKVLLQPVDSPIVGIRHPYLTIVGSKSPVRKGNSNGPFSPSKLDVCSNPNSKPATPHHLAASDVTLNAVGASGVVLAPLTPEIDDARSLRSTAGSIGSHSTSKRSASNEGFNVSVSREEFDDAASVGHDSVSTNLDTGSVGGQSVGSQSTLGFPSSFAGVPWLPRGTIIPLDHDRSHHIDGWREKNEYLRQFPHDSTRHIVTLKSQKAVRHAFEKYVQQLKAEENTMIQ